MKHLMEVHILQNFAPSNLNRDDTGSPKDAYFGGVRRGRISSQCLKRAAREYVRSHGLLDEKDLATRTKRIAQVVAGYLRSEYGLDASKADAVARTAIGGIMKSELKSKGEKQEHFTKVLIYLNSHEALAIAKVCYQHLDQLEQISGEAAEKARLDIMAAEEIVQTLEEGLKVAEQDEKEALKKKLADAKKQLGQLKKSNANVVIPDKIVAELKEVFARGRRSVDVALFGRMLAEVPRKDRDDAACQVAHAISTHAVEREFDYFTAVDDLNPGEDTGAGMLGTVEFSSSCYYRYLALDVTKLLENLEGNTDLALKGIGAFLKAIIKAKPSGKQNGFAAHNDPDFVFVTVRTDTDPRNLANAFEKPVRPSSLHSLTEASVERFGAKWKKLETAYGGGGHTLRLNLTEASCDLGEEVPSLDKLMERTLEVIRAELGV